MRTHIASGLLLVFFLGSMGCVPDNSDSPVVILYNQTPGESCTVSSSESGSAIIRGIIDTNSPIGYVFTPVVKNFAQTSDFIDVDQRIAYLEGATVKIDLDGQLFNAEESAALDAMGLTSFTTQFGAVVEPDEGTTGLLFELVSFETWQFLADRLPTPADRTTMDISVYLFGRLGGSDIRTQDFSYTIDVCNGCLINDVGPCSALSGDATNTGGNCNPLQDTAFVDCCTENETLICPALATSAP